MPKSILAVVAALVVGCTATLGVPAGPEAAASTSAGADEIVAFVNPYGPAGIYVRDLADGVTTHPVAGVNAKTPALSPDGRQIAYAAPGPAGGTEQIIQEIWVAPTDGSAPPRQVTSGFQMAQHPTWSPDGRLIAYTDGLPVAVADAATGQTVAGPFGYVADPSFSPDGTELVGEFQGWIVTFPLDGGPGRNLGQGVSPRWSPDGDAIAFGVPGGGPTVGLQLWTMSPDGSNRHELAAATPTSTDTLRSWAWSSDGQTLVVSGDTLAGDTYTNDDLFLVDRAGTARERLTDTPKVSEDDVSAVGSSPPPVPPPPPAATAIRGAASATIYEGGAAALSATLTDATTGDPIAGAPVTLQSLTGSSGSFTPGATTSTSATGQVRLSVMPRTTTEFRWSYAGDADHAASVSPVWTITVLPPSADQLTIGAHAVRIRARHGLTVRGRLLTVADRAAIGHVALLLQARADRTLPFRTIGTAVTGHAGRATLLVHPRRTMQYRWRYRASSRFRAAVSSVETVSVLR